MPLTRNQASNRSFGGGQESHHQQQQQNQHSQNELEQLSLQLDLEMNGEEASMQQQQGATSSTSGRIGLTNSSHSHNPFLPAGHGGLFDSRNAGNGNENGRGGERNGKGDGGELGRDSQDQDEMMQGLRLELINATSENDENSRNLESHSQNLSNLESRNRRMIGGGGTSSGTSQSHPSIKTNSSSNSNENQFLDLNPSSNRNLQQHQSGAGSGSGGHSLGEGRPRSTTTDGDFFGHHLPSNHDHSEKNLNSISRPQSPFSIDPIRGHGHHPTHQNQNGSQNQGHRPQSHQDELENEVGGVEVSLYFLSKLLGNNL